MCVCVCVCVCVCGGGGSCVGLCFVYALLCAMSSFIIILTRKRELMVLCLFTVNNTWLFLMVPCVCLQCVIVVFSDHTHLFCNPLCSIISPIQNI